MTGKAALPLLKGNGEYDDLLQWGSPVRGHEANRWRARQDGYLEAEAGSGGATQL